MKLLRLRLRNLAAFAGEYTLDFTASPLRESGLFAITGPTGAGKSTLLDALCLALFGNTPRLRHTPNQTDIENGKHSLFAHDPRTLLRRGCADGFAEVDFIGQDGKTYQARWSVKRARNRPNGQLQNSEQSLSTLPDKTVITAQKRSFNQELPQRLGLNFEQFTRTVLLAQSEFSAFLKANDNERSALLERLTNSDIYSRVSIQAFRQAKEAQGKVTALTGQLDHIQPCNPDARRALEHAVEQACDELLTAETALQHTRQRQQHHHQLIACVEQYHEAHAQHQQALAHVTHLADQRQQCDALDRIAPMRTTVHDYQKTCAERDTLAEQHTQQQQTLKAAQHAREDALRTLQARRETLAQTESQLACTQAQFEAARDLARHLEWEAQRRAPLEEKLAHAHIRLERLSQQCQESEHRKAAHQHALATLDEAIHALSPTPVIRVQTLYRRRDALLRAQQRLHALTHCWQQYQTSQTALATARQTLAHLTKTVHQARKDLTAADRHRQQTQQQQQHTPNPTAISALRHTLTPGDACPVCGSHSHPDAETTPALDDTAYAHIKAAADAAQLTYHETLTHYERVNAEYQQAVQHEASCRQQHNDANTALGTYTHAPERLDGPYLEARAKRLTRWLMYIQETCARLEPLLSKRPTLNDALHQEQAEHARLTSIRHEVLQTSDALTSEVQHLSQASDTQRRQLAALLEKNDTVDAWQQQRTHTLRTARLAVEAAEQQYTQTQAHFEHCHTEAHRFEHALAALNTRSDTLGEQLTHWRARQPDTEDWDALLKLPEHVHHELRERLQQADNALHSTQATLEARTQLLLDTAPSEVQQLRAMPEQLTAWLDSQSEQLENAVRTHTQACQTARQRHDEARLSLKEDDQRREHVRQMGEALAQAQQEHRRWGRISELIGSSDGKVFRRIAQAYHLDVLVAHANAHLTHLIRRFRLKRGGTALGLLIIDQDMGDEQRSVHSLSGGETFLVSLALALGLAAMTADRMRVGTLLIDEGFGSLDVRSRALVMDALDALQAQGRQVGIISHVQEMHERIPVQVRVIPQHNGASTLKVTGPTFGD